MRENGAYRLADFTAIEPLVNRWAVWSDLISPVPYSLHMVHYQMKVLESYLSDPEMHVEVCGAPSSPVGRLSTCRSSGLTKSSRCFRR